MIWQSPVAVLMSRWPSNDLILVQLIKIMMKCLQLHSSVQTDQEIGLTVRVKRKELMAADK